MIALLRSPAARAGAGQGLGIGRRRRPGTAAGACEAIL